jgi:hypothetical protein
MAAFMNFSCKVRRIVLPALPIILLSACTSDIVPAHKHKMRAGRAPLVQRNIESFKQCTMRLDAIKARYTPLPDQHFGSGCSALGAVKLNDIGVATTNLGAMTCPLAANFAAWARYGAAPAARLMLGAELVRIDTFGTYNCRNIAGSARLSEHAHSNAVDIAAFVLSDGRRITVQDGWHGDADGQRFLRTVRSSACKRFRTVLSPDYNPSHHDHLHFDMGRSGAGTSDFCR